MATTAPGLKISKTTPCTVAGKGTWRPLACAIPPRQFDSSGKSRVNFQNTEICKTAREPGTDVGRLEHAAGRPPSIYIKNEISNGMPWRVEILNETVATEIAALPEDMQARFLRLSERILQAGLEGLAEPHVKHLEGKLWELRLTGRDGIARALYVTAMGRRVIVVRAFVKKKQKTPRAEIELALRRAKEIV